MLVREAVAVEATERPSRVVLQLQTVPTSHAVCRDARMQTPALACPSMIRVEGSFVCSSFWYIILLFALRLNFAIV